MENQSVAQKLEALVKLQAIDSKIAEIREKKKIVIDEHSGRILADVDMDSLDEGDKPKTAKAPAATTSRRRKVE